VPVHKICSTEVIASYRRISVTCVTCKIFEHVVANKIRHHLTVNGVFHPLLHGFSGGTR